MKSRWRRLHLFLIILPLLNDGLTSLASAQSTSTTSANVETPICDDDLRSKYCDAWYGGDLHTGCRFCGLGPQCPTTEPSGRGLKNQPDIKEEILRRHNEYRAVVRPWWVGTLTAPPFTSDDVGFKPWVWLLSVMVERLHVGELQLLTEVRSMSIGDPSKGH